MRRQLAILSLALLSPSLAQELPNPDYIPGAVLPAGWPEGVVGDAVYMEGLHFKSLLEPDLLVHFDTGELYLSYRVGRHEDYQQRSTGVAAAEVLSLVTGLDGVLSVTAAGLSFATWDSNSNSVVEAVVDTEWKNVTGLWVYDEQGSQRVWGRDPVEGTIRRMDFDGATFSPVVSLPAAVPPKDLVVLEYDTSVAGQEIAWLYPNLLVVTTFDGTQPLGAVSATSGDRIALLEAAIAGVEDCLVWYTTLGGESYLFLFNALASVGYSLGFLPRTDLMVYDPDGTGPVSPRALLPVAGSADATLVPADPDGDTLDTLPQETLPGPTIVALCAVDHDLDGIKDAWFAHDDKSIAAHKDLIIDEEGLTLYSHELDVPTFMIDEDGGQGTLTVTMSRNHYVPTGDFHVVLHLQPDLNQDLEFDPRIDEVQSPTLSGIQYEFSLTFDVSDLPQPEKAIFWIQFTSVQTAAPLSQVITNRYPMRLIIWSSTYSMETLGHNVLYPLVRHKPPYVDNGNATGSHKGNRGRGGSGT